MKADPSRYRVVSRVTLVIPAIVWAAAVLALALLLLSVVDTYQGAAAINPAAERSTLPLRLTLYVYALVFMLPGLWLFWYASRSMRFGAFPPPGSWVLADQQVQLGSRARVRGFALLALGAIFVGIAGAWAMLGVTLS